MHHLRLALLDLEQRSDARKIMAQRSARTRHRAGVRIEHALDVCEERQGLAAAHVEEPAALCEDRSHVAVIYHAKLAQVIAQLRLELCAARVRDIFQCAQRLRGTPIILRGLCEY